LKAVILAAGMGTRLRPLTLKTPKCLICVNGTPFVENALFHLNRNGIESAVIVIGYLGEGIKRYLGNEYRNTRLHYVENNVFDKTGNIYSLWLARQYLEDDIILLEDDIFFEGEVIDRLCHHKSPEIVVVDIYKNNMNGTGVNVESDIVTSFIMGQDITPGIQLKPKFKTVNIYRFSRSFMKRYLLPKVEELVSGEHSDIFYETAIGEVVKKPEVRMVALSIAGLKWFEIDTPEDLSQAETMFTSRI
jgi:choline kinase